MLKSAALGGMSLAAGAAQRPNILFAISDDQSWLHTSAGGDPVVRTPAFDRVARSGVRFTHAFSCAPSCTPSRGAILTGQDIWRLEHGANLWSTLDKKFDVYPDLLEAAGYQVGFSGKGWSPGDFKPGGRTRNPAGPQFKNFREFHASLDKNKPFCYWFGSFRPHRDYPLNSGLAAGLRPDKVTVPPWIPDVPVVRDDMLDYFLAIQKWDQELADILGVIDSASQFDNTLIIATSDNGMPFPRAKATVYDSGLRMPLAISWPARFKGGRVIDDMVSAIDYAPTILEAAGLKPAPAMTGRSLMNVLLSDKSGRVDGQRTAIYGAMERHALCRTNKLGYPMRAMRTYDYLYIRNFEPDRGPAGVAEGYGYGEIDNSPTKSFVLENKDTEKYGRFFRISCANRPAEELYDLKKDPAQLNNVAAERAYAKAKKDMASRLEARLRATRDPRIVGGDIIWDTIPHSGGGDRLPDRKK